MRKKLTLTVITLVSLITLSGCASWQRSLKGLSSEFGGGLYRELKVVSQTGETVYEDAGKFDIEVNDYRVKYINEYGKLIIVYLGGSTAIVTEK